GANSSADSQHRSWRVQRRTVSSIWRRSFGGRLRRFGAKGSRITSCGESSKRSPVPSAGRSGVPSCAHRRSNHGLSEPPVHDPIEAKKPGRRFLNRFIEAVYASRGLTPTEKALAARLGHYANSQTLECFPSVPTLAEATGMTQRNVYKVKNSL